MANVLGPNQVLEIGDSLFSENGQFEFTLQNDGNLVLYRIANRHPLWHTQTNGQDVMKAIMQPDGNFVLYGYHGALWASATNGNPGSILVLQDDGNLVVYQQNVAIWATNTRQ
jgi:hypothetical protein